MIVTNIDDHKIIQAVSIIYLSIYLIDIKCVHSFLQYQSMIVTNIDDHKIIQAVSIIYL